MEKGLNAWPWHYSMLAFGVIFLLMAWIVREYWVNKWYKSTGEYDKPVSVEVKDKIWETAGILLFAAITTILFVAIIVIIVSALGGPSNVVHWLGWGS